MDSLSLWLISSAVAIMVLLVVDDTVHVEGSSMEFKVGGPEGWHPPFQNETAAVYIEWASSNIFHVGDYLRFEYKNDSVLVVDKYCFYHCNSSCTKSVYEDGNTTLRLDKPGPAYFISGNTTHCKQGQRLVVQVLSYNSPPSIAIPPDSSYTAPAPSPSSTTTSFAPPPPLASLISVAAAAAYFLFANVVALA